MGFRYIRPLYNVGSTVLIDPFKIFIKGSAQMDYVHAYTSQAVKSPKPEVPYARGPGPT